MPEEFARTLVAVAVVLLVVGLLLTAGLVYLVVRYKPRVTAIAAAVGALVYGISPVDLAPEALLGPIGTLDDLAVWGVAAVILFREVQRRRAEEAAGTGDESTARGPVDAGGEAGGTRPAGPGTARPGTTGSGTTWPGTTGPGARSGTTGSGTTWPGARSGGTGTGTGGSGTDDSGTDGPGGTGYGTGPVVVGEVLNVGDEPDRRGRPG